MNLKQFFLADVLLCFAVLTVWAVATHSPLEMWEAITADLVTVMLAFDVLIALSLIVVWMVGDAPKHGLNPWGYVLLTALTGSVGPLAYLIRREGRIAGASESVSDEPVAAVA